MRLMYIYSLRPTVELTPALVLSRLLALRYDMFRQ